MDSAYYTAEEAAKALKMSHTTFHREVTAGHIPYEIDEGKKRGRRFPKEAINVHVLMSKAKKREHLKLRFTLATNADVWQAIQNARRLYGDDDIIPYKKVLEWREINDEMTMSMKSGEKLVGCTTFIPSEENSILSLIRDEMRERQIPTNDIKKWTDPNLCVYIASIAVVSSGDENIDKERGSFLLRHTIKWAITLTHQYDIRKWYAIGTTPEGQTICETLGFTEILSLDNGARKGYILTDMKQPAKLLQAFANRMRLQPDSSG